MMKLKLWLLVACSMIIAACGGLAYAESTTAPIETQPTSSVKYIEENQVHDNEVDYMSHLDEALTWRNAELKHFLTTEHTKQVEAAQTARKRKVFAAQAASGTAPPVIPSGSGFKSDAFMWRLARCEAGEKEPQNWNTGNGFYGYFQFMLSTWRSNGGTGYPHEHPYEVQVEIARRNITIANFSRQHPHCSRVMRQEGWW